MFSSDRSVRFQQKLPEHPPKYTILVIASYTNGFRSSGEADGVTHRYG
jgi:hypothetical protein